MENPAEVQELRNKLRMMNFPQGEIIGTVRKQQRAIHNQRTANQMLKVEAELYEREIAEMDQMGILHAKDERLLKEKETEQRLTNEKSVLENTYEAEKKAYNKLREEVSKAESNVGGMYTQAQKNRDVQERIAREENRLDKSICRYNESLQRLNDKRTIINELRQEKEQFLEIIEHAHIELDNKEKNITVLIESSNKAYSERDELKMDLGQLRQNEKEDCQIYKQQMDHFESMLDASKITQTHPSAQNIGVVNVISHVESGIDRQEETISQTDEKQNLIKQILSALSFTEIDQLYNEFEQIEKENFSLYNFTVEKAAKNKKIIADIEGMKGQIVSLTAESDVSDSENEIVLTDITTEISKTDAQLKLIEEKEKEANDQFAEIFTEIESLSQNLECEWGNSPDGKTFVTTANANYVLSNIEDALSNMVARVSAQASDKFVSAPHENTRSAVFDNARPLISAPTKTVIGPDQIARPVDTVRPMTRAELASILTLK